MNEELEQYIASQLNNGIAKETIRNDLLSNKWSEAVVDEALAQVVSPQKIEVKNPVNTGGPGEIRSKNFSIVRTTIITVSVLCIGVISLVTTFFSQRVSQEEIASSPESVDFTQTELVTYVRPAIVSIITRVEGSFSIGQFVLDFKNLTIEPLEGVSIEDEFDEIVTGSGFVVNPEGFIVTNSHVVGAETFKDDFIDGLAIGAIYNAALQSVLMGEVPEEDLEDSEYEAYGEKVREFIKDNIELKLSTKTYVANMHSEENELQDIVEDSFEAEVIYENRNLRETQRDVALIKINETNLPSLDMHRDSLVEVGQNIFVFGFPASAQINRESLFEPSFTKGSISSIKRSDNDEFNIFELDAKISAGSSGGPVFDNLGRATGIITWQSGSQEIGDNFAFALPISFADNTLQIEGVENELASYNIHFSRAIKLMRKNHCKLALNEFTLAEESVNKSFIKDDYLQNHKKFCEDLIESGESIDTTAQEFKAWLGNTSQVVWYVIGGIVTFALLLFAGYQLLSRRISRNTQNITQR